LLENSSFHVVLRREGRQVNAKRVYRLYRDMGLQLRQNAQASGQG
jgi:hypothetical protein